MQKYISDNKIDLLIPDNQIGKTSFLKPGKFYRIDTIVTAEEIEDSVILQDSDFQFRSICKIPTTKAKVILKYPEQYQFNYQMTDQSTLIQKYIEFLNSKQNEQLSKLVPEFLEYIFNIFNIQDDPVRQQCLLAQINHFVMPASVHKDVKSFITFLSVKLQHHQKLNSAFPRLYF